MERRATMKKLLIQMIKFGIVGVIAFVIDYSLMVLFVEVFHWNTVVSTGLSFTISLVVNYLLSMKFVFKAKENLSKKKEILIFVITSVIGLLINLLIMYIGDDLLHISYLIDKLVATVIVMIWNFVTKKLLLENNNLKKEKEHEKENESN